MTRGNQREIDRERARKRNADKGNEKSDFLKTKDKHADVMREKQKMHEEKEKEKKEK